MDLATAAMGSLLPKLFELLHGEYKLQKGVKKDVEFLQKEMRSIDAALRKVAMVPRDQLHDNSKIWASDVRELAYEMEDVVDRFMVGVEGFEPASNQDSFKGFVKKVSNLFTKGKTRHQIADAIKGIKDQVQEVSDRRNRYKIDDVDASLAAATIVDPRLMTQFEDQRRLVGIEEPRDELIKRLVDEDDCESKQQLKILSIFGSGGLGKTTLARAVYDKLHVKFHCRAFVSVGQNPNLKNVLIGILLRIDQASCSNATLLDEVLLIEKLRGLLTNKRYLIIIDDIWDMKSWNIIKRAFIDSECGSRVIKTTRIFEVAKVASDIYKQKVLSPARSKELFCMRLSIEKIRKPYDEPVKIPEKILQKCGGIPLAIITIASSLANKPVTDWHGVYDTIGFGNEDNQEVDNTRKILLYSYYDLPYYPRLCLLHLSIYPEDYEIKKGTLIWKWVAEGYVHEEPGKGLFEVGERYFNMLIDRSMIQAVEKPYHSIIYACRVHDLVLDMIIFLSKEDSCVTVLNSHRTHTSPHSTARRLALQSEFLEQDGSMANTSMQQVRSYNATMCRFSSLPLLSNFKALRVLALEECIFPRRKGSVMAPEGPPYHLKHVGGLIHLRYIGIPNAPIDDLPEEIGNLRFLHVLDLRGAHVSKLPRSVGKLTQLKCMRFHGLSMGVLDWTNLTSLEELQLNHLSPDFLKELGKLTELRKFKTIFVEHDNMLFKDLMKILGNLQKLQVIEVDRSDYKLWSSYYGSVVLGHLRHLTLDGLLPGLPVWINSSCLPNLCHLSLRLKAVEAQDMEILGRFSELITLSILSKDYIVFPDIMEEGAFPKLRYLVLSNAVQPRFVRGAMPSLEYLVLSVLLRTSGMDYRSLENLPRLEKVDVHTHGTAAMGIDVLQANASLKHAVEIHPNRPTLENKI